MLLNLTQRDFYTRKTGGEQGSVVCCNIKGIVLVLFHSLRCKVSSAFLRDVYSKMPGTVPQYCKIAAANIDTCWELIRESKKSTTPITRVPHMICYVSGFPYMVYQGKRDALVISDFLRRACVSVSQKHIYSRQRQPPPGPAGPVGPAGFTDRLQNQSRESMPVFTGQKEFGNARLRGNGIYYFPIDEAYTYHPSTRVAGLRR